MHYNYKSDENILRMLIKINILLTGPNKKKWNLSYTVTNLNNSSPSIGVLQKTSVVL